MKKLTPALFSAFFVFFIISAQAADKVRFGTSVKSEPILVLPVLAAEDKGFFKENGLEVEWTAFAGDRAMFPSVAAGATDAGHGSTTGFIVAAAGGVPATIVADCQVRDYGVGIWVLAESRIKKPMDLKGTRIGVAGFGGMVHSYGVIAAKALGLARDVKFIAVGASPNNIGALKARAVDGIVSTAGTMAPLMARGEAREVLAPREYLPRKFSEIAIFAHKKFIADRPEAVRRMVKAVLQAMDYIERDEAWTTEKLKTFFGFTGELKWFYDRVKYGKDGRVDLEAIENTKNFMVEYAIVSKEKAPLAHTLFTNDFVR